MLFTSYMYLKQFATANIDLIQLSKFVCKLFTIQKFQGGEMLYDTTHTQVTY